MKKSQLLSAVAFCLAVGFYSLVFGASFAQAATNTVNNSNFATDASARTLIRGVNPGYLSYHKTYTTPATHQLLYQRNATVSDWNIIDYPTSGILTRNNDGGTDEKDACVDIDNSGFRFDIEIWANRGGGCGSNGTTTGSYRGGKVNFNPPNGVPVFLYVRDVDGLEDRQHISFTDTAVQDVYQPRTNRAFDVSGGNNLVSNGNDVRCSSDPNCNAVVLLRANSFNIKAGSTDGDSVMRVDNGALAEYRTLTFDPNGGSVIENGAQSIDLIRGLIWSHRSPSNIQVLREYVRNGTSNNYPNPTNSNGSTFLGWYDAQIGGNRVSAISMGIDRTLWAHWGPGIPTAYTLVPIVNGLPPIVSTGDQATFTTSVNNGSTINSLPTEWAVRKIIVPTGVTPPISRTNGGQFDCTYYVGMLCSQIASGTGRVFSPGPTPVGTGSYVETITQPAGFRVCYAVMVNSATPAPNNYSEAVACVVIGKSPNLEARNGDVLAGGRFKTESPTCSIVTPPVISGSQRQSAGLFYTSYATYGVTSYGVSKTFGSMGESYSTDPNTTADNLVFANTGSDGYFGNNTAEGNSFPTTLKKCLNDPFRTFGPSAVTTSTATSVNLTSLNDNRRMTATSLTVTAPGPIQKNKRIVIYAPNADVHITSNITYADVPYASIDEIPRIVILTDHDIIIHDNVTQIDGIYAARKNFYTCNFIPGLDVCEDPLTVNGAVVAGQNIVPLRTAGASLPLYGEKAETFNLRPDLLLGQLSNPSSSTTFLKTVNEIEVPARF